MAVINLSRRANCFAIPDLRRAYMNFAKDFTSEKNQVFLQLKLIAATDKDDCRFPITDCHELSMIG